MDSTPKPPKNPVSGKKNDNPEWQAGLQIFFELSGWLVGPLIAALFLGQWLDTKYQTKPWLFLLTTAIAFAITCIGIVLKTIQFIKQIESNQNPKTKPENPKK